MKNDEVLQFSETRLHKETGLDRLTLSKMLANFEATPGPRGAKLYCLRDFLDAYMEYAKEKARVSKTALTTEEKQEQDAQLAAAKLRQAISDANISEMKERTLRGELVEAVVLEPHLSRMVADFASAIRTLPYAIAVIAEGKTVAQLQEKGEELCREALQNMAKMPGAAAAGVEAKPDVVE